MQKNLVPSAKKKIQFLLIKRTYYGRNRFFNFIVPFVTEW